VPRPDGAKRYVTDVRPRSNTVVVGTEDLLGVDEFHGSHVRWPGPAPVGELRLGAQLRAHGEEFPATVVAEGDGVVVRLDQRTRGVAPGQSVVLYDGTRVVGSATITRTGRSR
jgi:tRNA-specific 2-thiouridylase